MPDGYGCILQRGWDIESPMIRVNSGYVTLLPIHGHMRHMYTCLTPYRAGAHLLLHVAACVGIQAAVIRDPGLQHETQSM